MKLHYSLAVVFLLVMGCADKMDAPPPVSNVPINPWVTQASVGLVAPDNRPVELFASCASCHMSDASGRSDGMVPRLAGQREKVLVHKLQNLRDGKVNLPVMLPFARALSNDEVIEVAHYISSLPVNYIEPASQQSTSKDTKYNANFEHKCASCHGELGQGDDALFAPKLCGQHAAYLIRRMQEIENNVRGDADVGMMAVLETVDNTARSEIAKWLSLGHCEISDVKLNKNELGEQL